MKYRRPGRPTNNRNRSVTGYAGCFWQKHPQVRLIQADYFSYDFGASVYDMAVSFESFIILSRIKSLGSINGYTKPHKEGGNLP